MPLPVESPAGSARPGLGRWHSWTGPVFLLCCVALMAGCGLASDEDRKEEIREKVTAGQFEEAERLARGYFAEDKQVLLVTLEFISHQKDRAIREAYKDFVAIEGVTWVTHGSGAVVSGRLLNLGDKALSGFGLRADLEKDGRRVGQAQDRFVVDIGPGGSEAFELRAEGFSPPNQVSVHVVDLGFKR